MLLPDDRFDRTDKPYLMSCVLQNRFYQIRGSRLSLCTGNADHLQLFCRVPKVSGRYKCQRITAVLYPDHRHVCIRRQKTGYILCHDQCFRAFLYHIRYESMPICRSAFNTDK